MKKLLLIPVIIIFVVTPFRAGSINYKNKEMSLISFSITIHPETKKFLDNLDSYFPPVKNNNADKILAKIKEQTWGSLVDILQSNVGMIILPINTFGNNATYDAYGFPEISISKAQRKGFSKFYMKIDLQISPRDLQHPVNYKTKNDSTQEQTKLKPGELKPVVQIILTTFPENGIIPLGRYEGFSESSIVWTADNASILDGLVNSSNKTDLSTLMSLINEAVNDLSLNMLIK